MFTTSSHHKTYHSRWFQAAVKLCARVVMICSSFPESHIMRERGWKTWKKLDAEGIMAGGLVFMTAVLFWFCIEACRHGFNFTDEAYYLMNMRSPHSEVFTLSFFGAVFHPLYKLLGGNIFALRAVDTVGKYILSLLLVWMVLKEDIRAYGRKDIGLAVVLSLAALSFMQNVHRHSWLATPSYNSLTFEAMLVCVIGVLLCASSTPDRKHFGFFLSGIGLTLCFLAKPTSAALLLCGLSGYFLISSKEKVRDLSLMYLWFVVSLLAAACWTSGSTYKFVAILANSYHDASVAGEGHGLLELLKRFLDFPKFSLQDALVVAISLAYMALAISCLKLKHAAAMITAFSSLMVIFLLLFTEKFWSLAQAYHFPFLNLTGILVLCIVYGMHKGQGFGTGFKSPENSIPLAALFFIMPVAYLFGTNTDYWATGKKVLIFPVLGVLVLSRMFLKERMRNFILPFAMNMVLVVALWLSWGVQRPYGNDAPLGAQKTFINLGRGLYLSEGRAGHIEEVQNLVRQAGGVHGMPIIDLAEAGPGYLYALGAESIGHSLFGGARRRNKVEGTVRILQRVSEEKLRESWVLVRAKGGRVSGYSEKVFADLGLNFPGGYEKRAEWKHGTFLLYAPKAARP